MRSADGGYNVKLPAGDNFLNAVSLSDFDISGRNMELLVDKIKQLKQTGS